MVKAGDVVTLKSGGESMTVGSVRSGGQGHPQVAECFWFLGREVKQFAIPVDALVPVPDENKKPGS